MFDNFLPIPDAESLPFYPLVLKLVVCVARRKHTIGFSTLQFAFQCHDIVEVI